jgi:saccharopine dehydrogenase-like NADP-dependent oxidoreductase
VLERLEGLVGASAQELAAVAAQAVPQSAETVSVHLVIVSAASGRSVTVRSITRPHFGFGGSVVSTASPAVAAVRLLARGAVSARGVLPPERCIDPAQMFAELEARGVSFGVAAAG